MTTDFAAQVERWPLDRLIPHARNARTHSEAQVAQIAGSIAEFGFVNPVLVGDDGVLVAGHGRILAARKLGLAQAPVIVLSHLTPTQRRALISIGCWRRTSMPRRPSTRRQSRRLIR
jgi:ParB-like chromosome segregation protein Spo0J